MKTATITEAKNGLSALIDRVRAGESIVILDRGTPVARLDPVVNSRDESGRIKRLERAGLIRSGSAVPPVDLIRTPAPELMAGTSAVQAILDERRVGR